MQCRKSHLYYDGHGQIKAASVGSSDGSHATMLMFTFDRDARGNVIRTLAKDAFGHTRRSCTAYEPEGIFPLARRNPAGHVTYTQYDPGLGVLKAVEDPNKLLTRWAHDGLGRTTQELRPDGTTTTVQTGKGWHDSAGRATPGRGGRRGRKSCSHSSVRTNVSR